MVFNVVDSSQDTVVFTLIVPIGAGTGNQEYHTVVEEKPPKHPQRIPDIAQNHESVIITRHAN